MSEASFRQTPLKPSNAAYRRSRATNPARLFWVTFFGEAKKVTALPGASPGQQVQEQTTEVKITPMPFFQTKNLCPACGENLKKNPPTPIKAAWYKYVKTPGFSCNSCQARLRTRFGQGEFLLPLVVGIPTLRLPYWKFVALFLALWLAGHAIALLFVSKYVELK